MTKNSKLIQAIFSAIDEVNLQLPKEQHLEKSIETGLVDTSGKLDSLGLINLIVAIEQKIEEEFEVAITLVDGSHNNSPFRTVGTLADYISLLLEEKSNA
ncbi:MAG: acyl carrier protein [bacterium]